MVETATVEIELGIKMMKLLVFMCFLCGAFGQFQLPAHVQEILNMLHQMCQETTKVTNEIIEEAKEGNLPDVPELKCYINCLLHSAGMIDNDGSIHFRDVYHMMPPDMQKMADKLVDICDTIHGETPCETAYLTAKCFYEADPLIRNIVKNLISV